MYSFDLSVIIPVFNIDIQLFERCLDSLNSRKVYSVELILVDDGSTNGCEKICDNYKSDTIQVIHKNNEGVASARNIGILASRGKWITFVDPDDYVSINYFDSLSKYFNSEEAEVVFFDYNHIFNSTKKMKLPFTKFELGEKEISELKEGAFYHYKYKGKDYDYETNVVWNKMFRKSFLIDNQINFEEKALKGEDVIFCAHVYICLNSAVYLSENIYNYVFYAWSVTNKYNENIVEHNAISFTIYADYIKKYNLPQKFTDLLYVRIITRVYSYMRLYFFNKNNKKKYRENKKEILKLINSFPYDEALSKCKYNFMNFPEKIFVFLLKKKMICFLKILIKLREIFRNIKLGRGRA